MAMPQRLALSSQKMTRREHFRGLCVVPHIELHHVETRTFDGGFVQIKYRIGS